MHRWVVALALLVACGDSGSCGPFDELPLDGDFSVGLGHGSPGFEKSGDNFNVNRSDQGWSDLDFSQYADGPAQRFVAITGVGQPIGVRWALPGGVIFDSRSPHYRELLDDYYLAEKHFDVPYTVSDINANGELRWIFR